MDLSKTFDSLSHDIVLNKLTYYGVKNSANDLLSSYLLGYEPADLTVHPPRTAEGVFIFFV